MIDPMQKYREALADFSRPGNRWMAVGRLAWWGKLSGLSADEIISDAHAVGVADRDADIRRGWNDARPQFEQTRSGWRNPARTAKRKAPPTFPRYVRDMVEAGGGSATSTDLRALSPFPIPAAGREQTAAFLGSLFDPADVLHVFRDDFPTVGKPGVNIMPCSEWMAELGREDMLPGDLIVANPFTGSPGLTTAGKPTYISQSCLARFPFAVMEFDELPIKAQAAFWRGLLTRSPLARKVAALVFSGNRSIHGLLYVGRHDLAGWMAVRDKLRGLFASDADAAYRVDEQALRPRTGFRLPGVARLSNNRRQALLYINPAAVRQPASNHDAPTAATDPHEAPCDSAAPQTGKDTPGADGRAIGHSRGLVSDCEPLPPTLPPDDAPLDDIMDALEVAETWAAADYFNARG